MMVTLLAFNRYVEVCNPPVAERLFSGNRSWWWLLAPVLYGLALSTSVDVPPIYNSQWSVFLFEIEPREDVSEVTANNWLCFANSLWVMGALTLIYTLLLREIRARSKPLSGVSELSELGTAEAPKKRIGRMQRRVLFQSFLICALLFLVLTCYAASNFVVLPLPMAKCATIAIQMCTGLTSIIYLAFNSSIRGGVSRLICGSGSGTLTSRVSHANEMTSGVGRMDMLVNVQ